MNRLQTLLILVPVLFSAFRVFNAQAGAGAPRHLYLPDSERLQAQSISPNGSVYCITPGTYDERGIVLLTEPGIYFCHNGTALIK